MTVAELIQSMLAPGIMISACALLMLGMNNKYSMVVNRIRVIDDEKRKLSALKEKGEISSTQEERMGSINKQLVKLAFRTKLVRNGVMYYSIAVGFFILACLSIGLSFISTKIDISFLALTFFLTGMISVFTGIVYAYLEARKGYEIIKIEISDIV
jgi:hypothetical protein